MKEQEMLSYIYAIKTFEKLDIDKFGCPDTGCCCRWGSFDNFKDAEYCVVNNITDIWETRYNYAMIAKEEFNCVCATNTQGWSCVTLTSTIALIRSVTNL